jgi:hypothetical protein
MQLINNPKKPDILYFEKEFALREEDNIRFPKLKEEIMTDLRNFSKEA